MLFLRATFFAATIALAVPARAQLLESLPSPPGNVSRYTECMTAARNDPAKAISLAEKWKGEGGGLGARHCVAIAMYESGNYVQAASQLEMVAHDMGTERPGLRAELLAQAGQAWMAANQPEKAASAQTRALELKAGDVELWIDRGLSRAALNAWPQAIADFDQAAKLAPSRVDILVLRAAAWRNAGDPAKALVDVGHALKIAPDQTDALLERGYARQASGDRTGAAADFNKVLKLVLPGSEAAKQAQAGLRGEQPDAQQSQPAASRPAKAPSKR